MTPVLISTAHRPSRLGFGNCSSIEIGLGLSCAFVEEVSEKLVGFFAPAAGGFLEAVEHALIFQPFWPARALENFAHDDQRAQAALGLVVSRRHALVAQKGEHVLLFRFVLDLFLHASPMLMGDPFGLNTRWRPSRTLRRLETAILSFRFFCRGANGANYLVDFYPDCWSAGAHTT